MAGAPIWEEIAPGAKKLTALDFSIERKMATLPKWSNGPYQLNLL